MTAPTIADPTAGLFDRRYELLELLGRGNFGEVWRARDTNTGRVVALKVLDGTKTTPDAAWREATRLTSLESPFLIRVHGAALAIDVPYLDMALAVKGSAAKSIKPYGVAQHTAVRWARQVAQGLHLCHQRGLLHRDVKPDNVLLDAKSDARLGDFGVTAVMASDGTASMHGDIQIRAPEVLAGAPCTVGNDVYSLGITIHALLTGDLPHRLQDHPDLASFTAAASAGPPDIRDAAPHVDLALAKAIRKATAIAPADRYETVADLDAALARIQRPVRDIARTAPHPGADRCWDATPASPAGPAAAHVCVTPAAKPGSYDVVTRRVRSGKRINSCCGTDTGRRLPVLLRSVFKELRT